MKNLNRIYILGTVGSGKSFLGNRISKGLGIKHYDLDDIYWERKYSKRRNKKKRMEKLKRIIKKDLWVIGGGYGSWVSEAIKKSDVVIILDCTLTILVWRVFKKLIKNGRIGDFSKLVRYTKKYKKSRGSSYGFKYHMKLIRKNNPNYILIKNNKQLNEFLKELRK